jgi:hypothetical protein
MRRIGLLVAVILMMTSCGPPKPGDPGNAFSSYKHPRSMWGLSNRIPVGEEWVAVYLSMRNDSEHPLSLLSVKTVPGAVSRSIQIIEMEVAPRMSRGGGSVPGGSYATYPPAWGEDGRCAIVEPAPIDGYVVRPGGYPRVMLHMKAVRPGPFKILGFVIEYEQEGNARMELIPIGIKGNVVARGREAFEPYTEERDCVRDGVRILP